MLIECCSQERSYLRFYGLLGQRLCLLNQIWVEKFDEAFQQQVQFIKKYDVMVSKFTHSFSLPTVQHSASLGDKQTSQRGQVLWPAVLR